MKPVEGKRVLSDELSALKLRAADKGRIIGEFEHHFFGGRESNNMPLITFDLSRELWNMWYECAKKIIELEKLDYSQPSETLEQFFQAFFKVNLPRGVRITPEICSSWNDKHLGFMIEIWRSRGATRRTA